MPSQLHVDGLVLGPTHPSELGLYDGNLGAESDAVNKVLRYSNPVTALTRLRFTEARFPVAIRYGGSVSPSSFRASLNGVDVTSKFAPTPDLHEVVYLDLAVGRDNVLVLSADGAGGSDVDRLVFLAGNQTPFAAADALEVVEDGSGTSDVLANDIGLGDTPLSLLIAVAPGHGSATVNADRTVTYTPAPNFFGSDTYSYAVTDAGGDSSTAAVSVTVSSVNDPPSAVGQFSPVVIGVPFEIPLGGSDVEDCELTFSVVEAPTLGTLGAFSALPCTPGSPNSDQATVAYTASATGADSFTFRVQDADGAYSDAVVEIFITPPGTALLGVHTEAQSAFGVDDAETLDDASCATSPCVLSSLSESTGPGSASTASARASRGLLLGSAAGSSENSAMYSALGSAFFTLTDLTFIGPEATVCGVELNLHLEGSLSTRAGSGARSFAEVTVQADIGGNAFDGTLTFRNGVYFSSTGLLFGVTDPAEVFLTTPGFCVPTGQPVLLTLSLAASVEETSDDFNVSSASFARTLSFPEIGPVFQLPSGFTADAPSAGILDNRVGGTPANHVPVAAPDAILVAENGSVTSDVLANDSGLEDAPLSLTVAAAPAHGIAIANADLTITYAPTPNFFGTDTYSYTVSDSDGESSTASVAVTVTSVDHTPVAASDAVLTAEDAVFTSDVLANDTGFGDGILSLTITAPPAHGSASINPNRTITYAPAPDFFGTDAYAYDVTDVDGDSSTASVAVTVTPVNDPPSALGAKSAGIVGVPVEIALVGTDVDDCELAFSIVEPPTFGTLGVMAARPCTPGAPNSDRATVTYTASAIHFDSLIFRVMDSAGASTDAEVSIAAVVVTIPTPTNRAPDCSAATAAPTSLWPPSHKLVPVSIARVTDPDGDHVTLSPAGVRQDEAVREQGAGAGSSEPDATLLPLAVRAERNGNPKTPGDGRVYHIAFSAFDSAGASCSGSVAVCVPHEQRPGATCVDGGPVFDSLLP